jgi:MFS family permease
MISRAFCGIGAGSNATTGAATIRDLFFSHERGIHRESTPTSLVVDFILFIARFIAQYLGWRQCFSLLATSLPTPLFCFTIRSRISRSNYKWEPLLSCSSPPLETIYSRRADLETNHETHTYLYLLFGYQHMSTSSLHPNYFLKPLHLLRYVSIVLP